MDKKIMIWIGIGVLVVGMFLLSSNAKSSATEPIIDEAEITNLREVTLAIKDMSCEGCAYGVKAQIEGLDGVVNADIDYRDGSGVVRYDADRVDTGTIAAASTAYSASVVGDTKI